MDSFDMLKLLETLTMQVTNKVLDVHLLREEAAKEENLYRTEEADLRGLEKEQAECEMQGKRARTEEAVRRHQYQTKLQDLKESMDRHRESSIDAEVNRKLLSALRKLSSQREDDLSTARRDDQWKPAAESDGVTAAIANQITADMDAISTRVEEVKNQMKRLDAKYGTAEKLVLKLSACKEAERTAQTEMEHSLRSFQVERGKLEREQRSSAAKIIRQPILIRTGTGTPGHLPRLSILKELEDERTRGANLRKALWMTIQQASEKASRREKWLSEQFS